jgi:hypothetical protein
MYEFVLICDWQTHQKNLEVSKKGFPLEPMYAGICTCSTKKLRHWHMQFETPACTILFLYQNHQDTPSKIQDLYESISMPDSQPLSGPSSVLNASLVVHFIILFVLRPVGGPGLPFFQSSYPYHCWSGIVVHPPITPLALAHSIVPPFFTQVLHSPPIICSLPF